MQIIIIHDETAYLAKTHVKITRFCEENKIDSTVRSFPGVREAVQDLQREMDGTSQRLLLELKGREIVLECKEILYMERDKRKTFVACADQETVVVSEKLESLLQRLDSNAFSRCHNSFVVNLRYVREYRRNSILLENGTEIPVSRKYTQAVRQQLENWTAEI